MDFGDLENDKPVQEKLMNFHNSVEKIENMIEKLQKADAYEHLTLKEKIDYDLFVAYTLNTLYWLYLRTKNADPNKNDVKNQLNRVKEYMMKAKQAHERQTIRPKIDQAVANRFVKHGIQYKEGDGSPINKKTKFAD
ncbi:unnamed protein product [Psylliodes chrysocephalus]|uniref:Nuclear nucleic acid-binding protein C1D n=1 Tax=Psylliodes chrysocephalus TaxID=3402493 RepID=A0A9P0GEY0_9CUCU|nr:unnamed protein product [Psylliodes chrysocephala]